MPDILPAPRPPRSPEVTPQSEAYRRVTTLLAEQGRLLPVPPGTCTSGIRYYTWRDPETGWRFRVSQLSRWARPGTYDNFATVRVYAGTKLHGMLELGDTSCYVTGELEGNAAF